MRRAPMQSFLQECGCRTHAKPRAGSDRSADLTADGKLACSPNERRSQEPPSRQGLAVTLAVNHKPTPRMPPKAQLALPRPTGLVIDPAPRPS